MNKTNGVLLLTGANGGLGQNIVKYLLDVKIRNIACNYRGSDTEIRRILADHDLVPEKHLFYADLTNESDIHNMRLSIEEKLGEVSTLVNLAGGSTNNLSWKLTKQEFQNVIDMNLLSTFLCSKEFIPTMRNNNFGTIINTSSVVGTTGVAGAAHYCAAKAGIIGLSKAMALELASKNITVNTLALGYFDQGLIDDVPVEIRQKIVERIPLKRLGKSKEVGSMIKYFLDADSRYITGQVFHINGGLI